MALPQSSAPSDCRTRSTTGPRGRTPGRVALPPLAKSDPSRRAPSEAIPGAPCRRALRPHATPWAGRRESTKTHLSSGWPLRHPSPQRTHGSPPEIPPRHADLKPDIGPPREVRPETPNPCALNRPAARLARSGGVEGADSCHGSRRVTEPSRSDWRCVSSVLARGTPGEHPVVRCAEVVEALLPAARVVRIAHTGADAPIPTRSIGSPVPHAGSIPLRLLCASDSRGGVRSPWEGSAAPEAMLGREGGSGHRGNRVGGPVAAWPGVARDQFGFGGRGCGLPGGRCTFPGSRLSSARMAQSDCLAR